MKETEAWKMWTWLELQIAGGTQTQTHVFWLHATAAFTGQHCLHFYSATNER